MNENAIEQELTILQLLEQTMCDLEMMPEEEAEKAESKLQENIRLAELSETDVSYLVSRILDAEAEVTRRRDSVVDFINQAKSKVISLRKWLEPSLEIWARNHLIGKARSVKVPGGTLGFRKIAEGLEITDEDAAIKWLEKNTDGEYIEHKPKIRKADLKKAVLAGNLNEPEGTFTTERKDRFYLK